MGKHERELLTEILELLRNLERRFSDWEAGDLFDGPERFRPRRLLRPDEYRDAEISEHFRHGMRDEDGD